MDIEKIPERFYIDLAVGVQSFADVCTLHNLDPDVVEACEDDPIFKQRVGLAEQAVNDDGRAFKARCRSIVNRSVTRMETLMLDPEIPASTRLDAFKTLAKYGELEPDKQDKQQAQTGPQLVFNIYGPDGTPMIEQTVQGIVVSDQSDKSELSDQFAALPAAPAHVVSGFF